MGSCLPHISDNFQEAQDTCLCPLPHHCLSTFLGSPQSFLMYSLSWVERFITSTLNSLLLALHCLDPGLCFSSFLSSPLWSCVVICGLCLFGSSARLPGMPAMSTCVEQSTAGLPRTARTARSTSSATASSRSHHPSHPL